MDSARKAVYNGPLAPPPLGPPHHWGTFAPPQKKHISNYLFLLFAGRIFRDVFFGTGGNGPKRTRKIRPPSTVVRTGQNRYKNRFSEKSFSRLPKQYQTQYKTQKSNRQNLDQAVFLKKAFNPLHTLSLEFFRPPPPREILMRFSYTPP